MTEIELAGEHPDALYDIVSSYFKDAIASRVIFKEYSKLQPICDSLEKFKLKREPFKQKTLDKNSNILISADDVISSIQRGDVVGLNWEDFKIDDRRTVMVYYISMFTRLLQESKDDIDQSAIPVLILELNGNQVYIPIREMNSGSYGNYRESAIFKLYRDKGKIEIPLNYIKGVYFIKGSNLISLRRNASRYITYSKCSHGSRLILKDGGLDELDSIT